MRQYLLKRLLLAVGIIFSISLITFFILNIIPGDPVALMLGDAADADTIATVRHNLGMDQPLVQQYLSWMGGLLTGSLGTSYFQHKPVADLLAVAFGYTARLALVSYIIALVIGLVLGIVSALHRGTALDRTLMTLSVVGISAPSFWVAIVLQIYIGLKFKSIPISGLDTPAAYLLPCISLGLRYAASIARITRTSMLEVMNQDFIRTARAKGLSPIRTVLVHMLRNALIPIITVIGTDIGTLFAGSMLTESVFNINGIGKLLVDNITKRDIPVVQGCVMYIAVLCVVVYLVVDILYAVVDPNIRLGGESA
jgi:peptide/nickel transport system permease protein